MLNILRLLTYKNTSMQLNNYDIEQNLFINKFIGFRIFKTKNTYKP